MFNTASMPLSRLRFYVLLFHLTVGAFFLYPVIVAQSLQALDIQMIGLERIDLLYAAAMTLSSMALAHPLLQASWQAFKKDFIGHLVLAIKTFLWMIALSVVINLIITNITGMNQSQNQNVIIDIYRAYPNLVIFQALIYAPIVEEILFRGLLYPLFSRKSVRIGLIISSLLFGLSHVSPALLMGQFQDLWFLPTYVVLGALLNLAYVKSKSLHVSILVHFLNNLLGLWAIAQLL